MSGGGCCGCCSAFKPRYKRLVDNIFPPNPEDGLVKSNMDKLMYYAMTTPDKLDRIGEYLAHRLNRDIYRRKYGYVIVSMDALDHLLISCHANNLNLFVESFLRMVQMLLESSDPKLQLRATSSFEKFADIREDMPSYHRPYDFLVSKFSSMCYSAEEDLTMRKQLRAAGIKGLQGVVRKTDWDNLSENIWMPTHMDKIVPSLLYNMQEKNCLYLENASQTDGVDHSESEFDPHEMAEMCLRELVSRATYGKVHNVVKPLLWHLDHQDLWVSNEFAVQVFKIIMFSIQVQYSVSVIDLLMAHLNEKSSEPAEIRTGIADVLSKVIPIAAGECIGPSVIEIINSLLEHIRSSVVGGSQGGEGEEEGAAEKTYQETLIHALGEYANHLPDYQKVDSMVFILNKVPGSDRVDDGMIRPAGEVKLQHILLKSLLKVGTKYTTVQFSTTFGQSFLVRLMRLSFSSDAEVRLTVQQILHTLIDRHDNSQHLSKPTLDLNILNLTFATHTRQDVNYWKKSGTEILLSLQENCEFSNNTQENLDAVYTTLLLLLLEIHTDDVIVDVLRSIFHIQTLAVGSSLSVILRVQLHALIAAVMVVIAQIVHVLKPHMTAVIAKRSDEAAYLLPVSSSGKINLPDNLDSLSEEFLFDITIVSDLLKSTSFDEKRLNAEVISLMRRTSIVQSTHSASDINAISVEVDSAASSPGVPRQKLLEEVTFESLKKVLAQSPEHRRQQDEEHRREVTQAFLAENFDTLVARVQAQPDVLQTKLSEIFSRLPPSCAPFQSVAVSCDVKTGLTPSSSLYMLPYPDIYIY